MREAGVVVVEEGEGAEVQQGMGLCLLIMRMEAGIRIEAIPGVGAEVEVVVSVVVEGEGTVTMLLWLTPSRTRGVTIEDHQFKAVAVVVGGEEAVEGVAEVGAPMALLRLLLEKHNLPLNRKCAGVLVLKVCNACSVSMFDIGFGFVN